MAENEKLTAVKLVILSYCGALMITVADLPVSYHYFCYSILAFFFVVISSHSKSIVLLIYGLLNYLAMSAYAPLIVYDNPFVRHWLYGQSVNFAMIYDSYEAAMLLTGGMFVLRFIVDRAVDAALRWYNSCKSFIPIKL